jgi:3-hydroxybenzoate 6-monooxygenase
MDILIAGGGIGGLAAALALARGGVGVTVLEKSRSLGEIGAGIQLGPNAFHAFDALGVGDTARAMAVYIDRLLLMDAMTSKEICHIDLGEAFRARFGNPYAVIHRGDLHAVLLRACREEPRITLRTSADVTGYAQDSGHVAALLPDGERITGAALIGADGLWSAVRRQLVGDAAPRVSGHTTYRSVIPTEAVPERLRLNAATLWAGPKCHLVHYPLQGWKVFNLAITCQNDAPAPVAGEPVATEEVLRGFAHIHPDAQAIVHLGTDWKRWVLCDREPTERWVEGRVALLGDAAHPMLQYYAQGACMALEDAVTLGACVAAHGDLEAALAAYRDARLLRATRVQLGSRALGEHIYHPAGAHARLRDAVMSGKSQPQWRDDLAWLYGYRAGAAAA